MNAEVETQGNVVLVQRQALRFCPFSSFSVRAIAPICDLPAPMLRCHFGAFIQRKNTSNPMIWRERKLVFRIYIFFILHCTKMVRICSISGTSSCQKCPPVSCCFYAQITSYCIDINAGNMVLCIAQANNFF